MTAQWLPNWNRGFAHVQRTELFGQGLERLVADLSAAEFVTANGQAKQPLFEGDELAVRFVRTAIGPNTRPGLEVVRISTMSDNRGVALVRARTPFVPLRENAKIRDLANFSDPVVLMRAPYRATFSYAGPDHVWQNSWRDADQLPIAIRVSVRDAATQRTLAVSTATVLRVSAPAQCARAQSCQGLHLPLRRCAARRFVQSRQMKKWRRKAVTIPGPNMASAAPKLGRKSNDGFILVAVLWILGGLAVLAAIYALYVVNAATSLKVNNDRIQANASVSAALELTAYYLGAGKPQERPTSGTFNFRVGSSNVAVDFLSEAARIDLNTAPPPLLAGLFRVLGAPPDAANDYAERIIGWRTPAASANPDADQGNDKETTAYRNAGLTYNPRLAPFTNVQELWLVLGLPPALVERAMPFVTVFSGMPSDQCHGCRTGGHRCAARA